MWQVKHRRIWQAAGAVAVLGGVVIALPVGASPGDPGSGASLADLLANTRTLDGRGNHPDHPMWGAAGTPYLRVAKPAYPDGKGSMETGPSARYISNRIFNDSGQNLFSENDASQWVWIWGQFIDHDIGLRDFTPGEDAPIKYDADDPLESYKNEYGKIGFNRTPAAPGTGTKANPREQVNEITSFIDASQIYGSSPIRLDWLREGPVDGDPTNNSAKLLLPNGFLPRAGDRDKRIAAPVMEPDGKSADPRFTRIAGDFRANENAPLTLTQTLFAREHNRIVDLLASSGLTEEQKFQAARKLVGAEIEFITYNEFLPAVGVRMPQYAGFKPDVNPSLSNEFATVGYRAHSMVHGEFDPPFTEGDYSDAQLDEFRQEGIGIVKGANNGPSTLEIPLSAALGNPDLVGQVGIGRLSKEFADGHQYRNDEMIDDSMRSVLFQIPRPGARDPKVCGKPIVLPDCYSTLMDLGAIDLERARDHGIPTYNELRKAYGLAPKSSFEDITGENSEDFPADSGAKAVNDPKILEFTQLLDINSQPVQGQATSAQAQETAVTGIRRTTTAARLKAIYGNVNKVDAFVGMMCEPHVRGEELGELQKAMWTKQFVALRDGDQYFYANDPALQILQDQFGITYRHSLSEIIALNTGVQTDQADVFTIPQKQ